MSPLSPPKILAEGEHNPSVSPTPPLLPCLDVALVLHLASMFPSPPSVGTGKETSKTTPPPRPVAIVPCPTSSFTGKPCSKQRAAPPLYPCAIRRQPPAPLSSPSFISPEPTLPTHPIAVPERTEKKKKKTGEREGLEMEK